MAGLVIARAAALVDASLGTTALTAFSGVPKVRLTTTAPTSTAAGTELTGTGYTAGGIALTANLFQAASTSTGLAVGPHTSALQWTNGSGSAWSIVGVEVWDQAGTPLRWWWGLLTGQPVSVPNGALFQIAVDALSAQIS